MKKHLPDHPKGIRFIRRLMHVIFYSGILLTVLTIGLYALLQTRAANDYLRQRIVATLEGATRARFEIGRISGNLITGATIEDAAIYNPESDIPLFAFDTIRATYALPLLLTGRLHISAVEVDGFSSCLAAGPDGRWNTAALLPPEAKRHRPRKSPPAFQLTIGEVAVGNAEMTLSWYAGDKKRELRFTDGKCRTRLTIGRRIENDIRDLSFRMPWPGVTFDKITGGVDYDIPATRLGFDETRFRTRKASDLTVDGGVTFRGGADFDLKAAIAQLAAEEIGRLCSIPVRKAAVSGRLEVNGRLDALAHRISLYQEETSVETEGVIRFEKPGALSLHTAAAVSHYSPETFAFCPAEGLSGDLSGAVRIDGQQLLSPKSRRIEVNIAASASELAGFAADAARLDAEVSADGIQIDQLEWHAPYGSVQASGCIVNPFATDAEKPFELHSALTDFNPAVLPLLDTVRGALNVDLDLGGTLSPGFNLARSDIDLTAHIQPSTLQNFDHLTGDAALSWSDRRLAVRQLALVSENAEVDARTVVDFNDDSCQGRFCARLPDLAALAALLPAPCKDAAVSGAADLEGQLSGVWYRPDFSARAELKNLHCRQLSAEQADLAVQGTVEPEGVIASGNLDGTAIAYDGLKLSELASDWSVSPDRITLETKIRSGKNRAALAGSILGWQTPEKEVTLNRFHLSAAGLPPLVNAQPIEFALCGDRLELRRLHLQSENATLAADGHAELIPGGGAGSRIHIADFDLQRLTGFFPALERVRGTLSGDIRLSDRLSEPAIDAAFDLSGCGCYGVLLDRIDAAAHYRDGQVTFSASGLREDTPVLTAEGALAGRLSLYPFAWEPKADGLLASVSASGFHLAEFDLPFADDYEADGTLCLQAALAGNPAAPRLSGTLSLKDAHVHLPGYGLTYETVAGDIDFSEDTIRIRDLRIEGDKEGRLNASGQIAYTGAFHPERFTVDISGSDFQVPFRNAVFVRTEPELSLTGTPGAPVLTGRIAVAGGRVLLDRVLKQQPAEIEVIEPTRETDGTYLLPEPPDPLSFLEPLAADIVVEIEEDLWVKGKEENLEIAGQVRLDKAHGDTFTLYGTLYSVRGTYLFRNRLFRITTGEIRFLGLEDIDPNVNIEAQTRLQDVTIIIRLTGSFKNLQLVLDSKPQMQTVDIISYLMFGRPVAELSQGESFRAEEAALSITGQLAADQLKAILGDSFRLDLIHISTGNGDISKGTVSLGKYIAPNLFVTYNQGFTQEVPRSVEVDYEITKHFSIEAQIDQERTSAVDLIWKHDYSGFLEFLFDED